jgi:hypothetical protein
MKRPTHIAAGVAAAAIAGSAGAVTELQLDINAIEARSVDAGGNTVAFGGLNHTGGIVFTASATTLLAEILFDGAPQGFMSGQLATLSGQIDLVNGDVTGGSLSITLNNGDTFNATMDGGAGEVQFQAGEGFSIDGLISSALFSDSNFGGIDITPWFSEQPLSGAFLAFAFDPDSSGVSTNTSLDVFLLVDQVIIPTPLAGGMALAGLLPLGALRRRG